MKRLGWGASAFIVALFSSVPASALDTSPSSSIVVRINGPLIITGYSFSGQSLRYLQVYNTADEVVSLNDWRVMSERTGTQVAYKTLSGKVAPKHYVSIANVNTLPTATFTYVDAVPPGDQVLSTITLLAPTESNYNNEVVSPAITTSTPRVAGTPATFYYARNVSATTGSYLTTFTAFVPPGNFTIVSDQLYVAPASVAASVVEIYPDSPTCAPFDIISICSDYAKIRNDSSADIDLSKYRLRTGTYGQSSTSSNSVRLYGTLSAGEFSSIPITLSSTGGWVWLEDAYGTVGYEQSLTGYPSSSGYDGHAWSYDDVLDMWRWSIYPTPSNGPNRFAPTLAINQCTGLELSEIAANVATEDQFIEIMNVTDQPVDLAGCALQTNRSSTKTFIFGSESLAGGAYRTVYLKDTELTLTKTTTGVVYLLSSDISNELDQADYARLAENTSWIRIDGSWMQTYGQTPDQANTWLEYPACDVGYFRNLETGLCNKTQQLSNASANCGEGKVRSAETNRCRSIKATGSSLVPCTADQYRSTETNRCRSLLMTASMVTPCAANQERSHETNRCRSVDGASEMKACAANQERNPDTNRCRNKTSAVATDFPVEAVAQSGEATLGWWAFGGVGTLAAGYAGWEWRREAMALIRKIRPFGIGRP